jgi:hypothetical protein
MKETLTTMLVALRDRMERAFAEDTAGGMWNPLVPSAGHCALASIVVRGLFDGYFISARPGGVSHWFNRVPVAGEWFDVDVTGDQFGRPRVQVAGVDELFRDCRARSIDDLNRETWQRYERFVARLEAVRA